MSRNQKSQSKQPSSPAPNQSAPPAPKRPAFNLCVQVPEGRDANGDMKKDAEGRVKTKLFRCGALWKSKSSDGFSGNWVDTFQGKIHRMVLLASERRGDNAPDYEVFIADGDSEKHGLVRFGAVWAFRDTEGFSGSIEEPMLGLSTRIVLLPPKEGERDQSLPASNDVYEDGDIPF